MKNLFALAVISLALVFGGCGRDGKTAKGYRIGVSIPAATHGWAGGVVWSAEQSKKQHDGTDVEIFFATSSNPTEQADSIENLLVKGVDALVVMAQEPGPLTQVCKKAKEQGVFLTVVSNPLAEPIQDIFVNGDNVSFGDAAGKAIIELLGGKGNILVMEGIPCPINTERVNGFNEALKAAPGIKVMESQPANWNTQKGLELMEGYLLKYQKIDAVWAGDDDVLLGAIKAYRESGRKDVKAFVGGGGSKQIVKMIIDGDPLVKATVTYPPQMISTAIEATIGALKAAGAPFAKEITVKSAIVNGATAQKHYFPESVY